jgi:DNA-binding NtrC family response regulator
MNRGSLLLVDDDRSIRQAMTEYLEGLGYSMGTAGSYEEVLQRFKRRQYHVVISDINLPDKDGIEVLTWCREHHPDAAVILITGYGSIESAVEAFRLGAFDYLTKPLIDDELVMSIDRALSQRQLVEENRHLRAQLETRFGMDNLVGQDFRMQRVFEVAESVADTRTTVLITGESGTGKTLCARAIHRSSSRRDGPFVEVACGALPETLLESELFGHAAGSFTGAVGDRVGKFKLADGGTIFLDEIATSSPALQVKLLRVLQDMEFEPVGSTETQHVDARVILATNQDLAELVAEGTFRQDLYYRINVVVIELPALRERLGDIPVLAEHFLEVFRQESGKEIQGFTDQAMAALHRYRWPGNVRELENVIERAVVLGKGTWIDLEDLPAELLSGGLPLTASHEGQSLKDALADPERQIILEALKDNGWNRQQTAQALGINRTTLYKKMRKLGLQVSAQASA